MGDNWFQAEKNFTSSLITALSLLDYAPTRQEVVEKAQKLASVFGYSGPLDAPVDEALTSVDTRMGIGISLVDIEAKHDEEWVLKRSDINWTYSDAYEKFLKSEKWPPTLVQSLSDVGTKILGHLQDPESEGSWDRRGLVIGHVQSGKTANYLGLISKAADAGYKFIIVIAGIHNNLRKQTQERIDQGFVGRSSDPHAREIIGVGYKGYPHPATLTNIYNDFNKTTANQSGWRINDFSKPIILVIKKNVSTLSSLHKWLKELNAEGDGKISDVPMLMIDDEADNASINTNKEDLDPTRTNSMIRQILSLFAKSCYVGYTATPFANIFINPDAYDDQAREELFPRDFIYCLDAPNSYFGADEVFLDDTRSKKILRLIGDAETYLPLTHKKDHDLVDLPPSLYKSVEQFIVARTIRNLRGQKNKHCSMMINVSRFVSVQNTVRTLISAYVKKIKEAVKANYAMPESVSSRNQYMASLEIAFREDFECEFQWPDVKAGLYETLESLRIFVVNSKSDEVLDYKKYEKDGTGLTAIAIGGLSLSRGLTIEGLTISYMYRNTRMYDTLMQMGRWFGYRVGYDDLCRVHLSGDSIKWYSHIAESSDELLDQIKQMRRDGLSPKKFGLYVRSHPDSLLITALNKMRSGEQVVVKQNLSGKLRESYILPQEEEINVSNRQLIEKFWKNSFGKDEDCIVETKKGWFIPDVETKTVEDFLLSFRGHSKFTELKYIVHKYLKSISEKFKYSDVLLISLQPDNEVKKEYTLIPEERTVETKEGYWELGNSRVASRGDEKLGLSEPQWKQADLDAAEDKKSKNKQASDLHYRRIRNKPLLMIHSLNLLEPGTKSLLSSNVPAIGVSFPDGDYSEGVEVVVNTVWLKQMQGEIYDLPDEEEDFDE